MIGPFRFRLARVLDVRRVEEQVASTALAEAASRVAARERLLEGLRAERVRAAAVKRAVTTAGVDLAQLRYVQQHLNVLGQRIAAEESALEACRAEVERRRGARVEAARAVRVLERLEARRRAEWARESEAAERRRLDEVALRGRATA